MNEEKLEKKLVLTKKGKNAIWVNTSRYTTPEQRHGYSSAICSSYGNLTRIIRSKSNYTKVKHLVKITPKCVFIQATSNIDGTKVEIYKVDNIDTDEKKITFSKVATFENGKWDDSSYASKYKVAIHSTSMRAKKYYNLIDLD